MQQENHLYLDQIAAVKREKEMEVTRMLTEFREEKEGILEKAQKDRHARDDVIRGNQIKADQQLEDLRSSTTFKRLEIEKKMEEMKERLEKQKDKLNLQVAELTEQTTKDSSEL